MQTDFLPTVTRSAAALVAAVLSLTVGCTDREGTARSGALRQTLLGDEIAIDDRVLTGSKLDQAWPSVAFDGTDYVVVWSSFNANAEFDLATRRLSAEADPIASVQTLIDDEGSAEWPVLSYGGGSFLVGWRRRKLYLEQVFVLGMQGDGTNSGAPTLVTWPDGWPVGIEDIVYDGTGHLLYGAGYGQRIGPDGTPLGAALNLPWSTFRPPSIAWGGVYAVCSVYYSTTNWDLSPTGTRVTRMTLDGTVLDTPFYLDSSYECAVAYGGGMFVAVIRAPSNALAAIRMTPEGGVLDADPIELADSSDGTLPIVRWDGNRFRVAWRTPRGIAIAAVRADGTRSASEGFDASVGSEPARLGMAADGAGAALLVYDRHEGDGTERNGRVYARRLLEPLAIAPDGGGAEAGGEPGGSGGNAGSSGGTGSVPAPGGADPQGGCACAMRRAHSSTWATTVVSGWLFIALRRASGRRPKRTRWNWFTHA